MNKLITIVFLSCFLLFACDSDSTNPPDGDTDVSELELEAEVDSLDSDTTDTSSDGDELDAELDAVEDNSIDGDDDIDAVEDELDIDFVDTDVVEVEQEIEVEQVVYPPTVIETLPYDVLTVTACATKNPDDDLPPATEVNRLVWGDKNGLRYFVDRRFFDAPQIGMYNSGNFFWVYDEANKTFSCEKEMDSAVFAMDGINTDVGRVIWLAQKNRLAKRKPTGEWLYFDIPDAPMPDGYYIAGGIQVDASGWVAVWGKWGIAFYNDKTDSWKQFDLPAFVDQPVVLHGSWHENKFYLPAGCKVLSWEIGADSLIEEVTIDGCDESTGDALYVIDKNDNNLKMAQVNWVGEQETYGALQKTVSLDLVSKVQNSENVADISECYFDECSGSYPELEAKLHLLPEMAGTPTATMVSSMKFMILIGSQCTLNSYVSLGPGIVDNAQCVCGGVFNDSTWSTSMTSPIGCYNAQLKKSEEQTMFSLNITMLLSTSFWRDGETLWLGSTRVSQELID